MGWYNLGELPDCYWNITACFCQGYNLHELDRWASFEKSYNRSTVSSLQTFIYSTWYIFNSQNMSHMFTLYSDLDQDTCPSLCVNNPSLNWFILESDHMPLYVLCPICGLVFFILPLLKLTALCANCVWVNCVSSVHLPVMYYIDSCWLSTVCETCKTSS